MNDQNNNNYSDLLGILSLVIGLRNLDENRQQSAHNDVQQANDKQASYLLQEINNRFDEMNQRLSEQNAILFKLLELLTSKGEDE